MKKFLKKITNATYKTLSMVVICAIAFLGLLSAPLMTIVQNVMAEKVTAYSSALTLLKMPKTAKLSENITIPFGKTDTLTDVTTVQIFNPKGVLVFKRTGTAEPTTNDISVNINNVDETYTFKATSVGVYKVQYSVESTEYANISTQEYKINVTGIKPEIEFEENSKEMIPSVTNGDYQIILPFPTVKDSEGNDVDLADVKQDIDITIKNTADNKTYLGSLAGMEGNIITKTSDGYYAFTPSGDIDGTYVVTYTYTDANGLKATEVFEIAYEKEFDASEIELGYKFNGSIPESMELGVEANLPSFSVYDKNDADLKLASYTEVEVAFIPNASNLSKYESKLADGKNYVVVANTFDFTPMYPTTDGVYKITYKISSFYSKSEGKVDETLVYTINDVKDSTAPTTYAVSDYSSFVNKEGDSVTGVKEEYEINEIAYTIPSKVATGTVVYLPAIFAEDNYSSYESMYSSLKRVIVPESGSNITVTTCLKDVSGELKNVEVAPYEIASYKFEKPGTYTIRYEATDEANKYNYTGTNFTIVVEDGFVDSLAPKITMTGIPTTAKAGETVSFVKPTAVDYATTSSTNSEISDKNLEVAYYYYQESTLTEPLEDVLSNRNESGVLNKLEEDKDDSTKLSFVAPLSNVVVVAVAYDDAGNMGYQTKTISIIDINDDVAPTITTNSATYSTDLTTDNTLKQDEKISLPDFEVSDGVNTKYLSGNVTVYDKDGNKVSVTGAKYTVDGTKYTIENAKFIASKAGDYTIVYTISDIGGNYLVKSYFLTIADTIAPTIELNGLLDTVEVGETITMPSVTVRDNGEILDVPGKIRFIGDNNPSYSWNEGTMEFTALESGIFTYEYFAEDGAGHETISGPYTFEAKDTIKPIIELDDNLDIYYPITKDADDNNEAIVIPGFTATDELNDIKETKVVVKSPSEKSLTVTEVEGGYSFIPTTDGIYTVTYYATDVANNTTELSFSIKIGDNTSPSIVVDNESANAPTEMKAGSILKLSLEDILVSDAGEELTAEELTSLNTNNGLSRFVVNVTGPNGSTVSAEEGSEYEYKLTSSGKYTITYTARDEAGNEKIIKKYIQVSADDNDSVVTTETWSIVLIIVSLCILAGVVIYFIKTRDKKGTKKIASSETKKEDKE